MARILSGLAAGLLFGAGLAISGMIDPEKVLGFLDVAGAWDPSLAFVMAGGLAVTFVGYRVVLRRPAPLLEPRFQIPTRRDIDGRLVGGAALFGLGWGLVGLCPGPALSAIGLGGPSVWLFVAAMLAGMLGFRVVDRLRQRGPAGAH